MSAQTPKMVACVECDGTGRFTKGGGNEDCPWCGSTGQVEASYAVYGHGWNGDFSFSELYTVESTLAAAKRYAERYMKKDRYDSCLEDGTPTLQWMEVVGQADEVWGCEEKDGRVDWMQP